MVRWLRWALFKDNLSFPGNVRVGDLLSKLLQIEFDIGDSLFQGFVFVWICSFLCGSGRPVPFPVRRHASVADQSALGTVRRITMYAFFAGCAAKKWLLSEQ